jgi:hypothetical protein
MREQKSGIPDEDTPAMTLSGEIVSAAPEPAAPVAESPAPNDTPGGKREDETPQAIATTPAIATIPGEEPPKPATDATGGSGEVPPVEAVVPSIPEVAAPVAAAPPRDKYDQSEPIPLLDGEVDWTRENIVRGLQERATQQEEIARLKPAAAERDQLIQAFGVRDTQSAMAMVEPFVRALRENPERGQLLDTVAKMDPATLAYIKASLQEFNNAPIETRQAWGQVGPAATQQTPTDPRYDQLAANQQLLEESLLASRAEREVSSILSDFPFLRNDRKAWEAVQSVATALYSEDEAKGVPPLQRRGYMEAIAQQRVFLDHMKTANERRVIAAASAVASPPQSALGPPPTSGILPATHPQPPVTARPAQRKEYRGPLDGASAAFLADLGYTK